MGARRDFSHSIFRGKQATKRKIFTRTSLISFTNKKEEEEGSMEGSEEEEKCVCVIVYSIEYMAYYNLIAAIQTSRATLLTSLLIAYQSTPI
jgi:hypothetical protein